MADITIEIIKNGPYIVNGRVELKDADGRAYPAKDRVALCRSLVKGDVLRIEKVTGDVGAEVTFNDVLMLGGTDSPKVGRPTVSGGPSHGRGSAWLKRRFPATAARSLRRCGRPATAASRCRPAS